MLKLYVGNLPFSATEDELRDKFGEFGNVMSAVIINDRETGRSRGFGFIEYANQEEGQAAIDALHDQDFGGRPLVVNEARPRDDRRGGGGGGGGGGRGGRGNGSRW